MVSVRPVLFHISPHPLRYAPTLALQNQIHAIQLAQRRSMGNHPDILLILQHRPVYTAGRRQADVNDSQKEETRLKHLGADWISTSRGGQTTYHGPGQLVGYPLLDLGRMGVRPSPSLILYLTDTLLIISAFGEDIRVPTRKSAPNACARKARPSSLSI